MSSGESAKHWFRNFDDVTKATTMSMQARPLSPNRPATMVFLRCVRAPITSFQLHVTFLCKSRLQTTKRADRKLYSTTHLPHRPMHCLPQIGRYADALLTYCLTGGWGKGDCCQRMSTMLSLAVSLKADARPHSLTACTTHLSNYDSTPIISSH